MLPFNHNIHSYLFDSTFFVCFSCQADLNEDVFTQFIKQLLSQGPQFTKSVKFAKMMLTVLTKYSSHVSWERYV